MNTTGKTILSVSAATAMFAGLIAPAVAETARTEGPPPVDPIMEWADQLLPRNEFVLNSDQDVELVRFKTPRDIDICIARPDPNTVFGTRKAVPVQVKWDNDIGVIWPGNCLSLDAKSVKIRPASPLPNDAELNGAFRVHH